MSIWPFKRGATQEEAEALLAAVVAVSRRPGFYGPGRVPDTLEGRVELMTLNASLVLVRLREAPEARELAQVFTDALFRHFDAGLREAAVGDLTVPKKMRKLAGDFYGRLEAYAAGLTEGEGLTAAIGRNMLGDQAAPFAADLARHARATARAQAGLPVGALGSPAAWPA